MPVASPLFTIIIPTFNHEETLRYSLDSVLKQTISDFEVHVIGDGASQHTEELVNTFSKDDTRIFYHAYPKSLRTGEEYRAEILSKVTSKFVCYLSDDDLWFPDHLEKIAALLETADFGYTFPIMVKPNGAVGTWYGDLTQPFYKKLFLNQHNKKYNVVPLSCAGHTLTAYRQLPLGWESTPQGKHTDLHMWQKFISQPGIKIAKEPLPTVIHLASSLRQKMSNSQRIEELKSWSDTLRQDPYLREKILTGVLTTVYHDFLGFRASLHSKLIWKIYDDLRNLFKTVGNFFSRNR